MSHAIDGIDHCIILVRDLEAARERMARLGFAPAPRGVHSPHMGTHNHCIMLERGYFEVLSILKPTEQNERWRRVLERREGLSAIALATGDARAAHAELDAAGIEATAPVDFSRPVDLPDAKGEARFTASTLPAEVTGGIPMFVCQHHTPELVWMPSHLAQPNGARALHGLTVVADDPGALADGYRRAFGAPRVRTEGDGLVVDTGAGVVDVLGAAAYRARYGEVPGEPEATRPYVAALTLESADPARTRAWLSDHGVAFHESARGGACIAPGDACGALIELLGPDRRG